MVKAKITMDNEKTREIKDCDLLVAIGLGVEEEKSQVQVSVIGGGLERAIVVQELANGMVEAINSLADNDSQAVRMLTAFRKAVENRCKAKLLERLTNGD